jgi:tetratricopeptide (TPR) repeat protein
VPPVIAAPQPPTQPLAAEAKAAARSPLVTSARAWGTKLLDRDWKRLLRAEVNAPYFWGAAGAAAVFVLLVCGALLTRASLVARPTAPMDPAVEKETLERKRALEDAKKLFSAGNYERSLALLRQVLARSPGNQQARQYAQMAENALAGRAEEARKGEEANKILESARAAFSENKYEDAVRYADEALVLDGGKIEAQQLKDQAQAKIAEARAAEVVAARKKKEEKKPVAARRQPTAAPARARNAPTAAPTAVAVAGPATLRLHFESPISEGSVMVYVNDEKVLQKSFDFSKKVSFFKRVEGTGTVEAPIQVKSGPVSVKVWLSGKGLDAAAYTTASGQLSGGETRTLKLDYSGGKLSAQIQ